jgi:hypothetical protein
MPNELWYWEERVPSDLISAVKHVRHSFEEARWKTSMVTQQCCFACLHPAVEESDEVREFTSRLVLLKGFIGQGSTQMFHDLLKRGNPSAILSGFYHVYKAVMAKEVNTAFQHLLEIGSSHVARLEASPIEWAEWQTKSIINSASYLTGLWLKRCCDPPTYDLADDDDPGAGDEEERTWTNWRAPMFVGMQPSLGMPFEASRVWEREDVESSRRIVKAFKQYFVIHLEAQLKDCVGSAHLEFAKQPKTATPIDVRKLSAVPPGNESTKSQVETLTIEQVSAAASKFDWKQLEIRFRDILAKTTVQEKLSAEFTRTVWDSGLVTGEWRVRGNPVWRTEFERLGSLAARKLGYMPSEGAPDYWLDHVRKWMHKTGMDKDEKVSWCPTGEGLLHGATYKTEHLTTEWIAELSATFCMELMARGTPESAVSPPSKGSDSQRIAPANDAISKRVKPKAITASEKQRRRVIFGAIQAGDEGQKYCMTLDERRLKTPAEWIEGGCPNKYADAYKAGQPWRKRIQDEKSRYKKKFDATPASQLEKLLE